MADHLFRCSSLGKIMTEPRTKAEGPLSVGAKTYIRSLASQDIFGVEHEVSSKQMDKGIQCEPDSIALFNRVRGLNLAKNTERRTNAYISGEADLFNPAASCGHDLKTSWSLATFPLLEVDCFDKLYEWQMRGYMWLWDADSWEVNYAMVDTPEELCKYEPMALHVVGHIPEHLRLTTWRVTRDAALEAAIAEKVKHARLYYAEVIAEFDRTHRAGNPVTEIAPKPAATPKPASAELPDNLFA